MTAKQWLIYGATGFTGELIIKEAIKKNLFPIIAGRSHEKISSLAEKYKLPYRVFSLDKEEEIIRNISDISLVLHCAGPFIHTAKPMVDACLKVKSHYLDITGEMPVFELMFSLDKKARESEILIIPGVGFDVVPTDCMAKFVQDELPDANELDIAFIGLGNISSGTMKSMIELIPNGGYIRKAGQLESNPLGKGERKFKFQELGEVKVIPIPWGDLVTAYKTTGIPNITTYTSYPDIFLSLLPILEPAGRVLFGFQPMRKIIQKLVEWVIPGPNDEVQTNSISYIYTKAVNSKGEIREAWLNTREGYSFTAESAILCVEKTFKSYLTGTLTPSQAFGKNLVLEISNTTRFTNYSMGQET
ncbi:MAG: saccharopine dehydrogenase NADP-binding domain-containing protein [Leptospiraceae bacterium]|nr:saccharopine dehydrogenase NADP-binding domain-containing protein [Leptospiraceae bacterium]